MTILQVYAPIYALNVYSAVQNIKEFYAEIQEILKQTPKKDIIYISGDFSAKASNVEETGITDKFDLGEQNETDYATTNS